MFEIILLLVVLEASSAFRRGNLPQMEELMFDKLSQMDQTERDELCRLQSCPRAVEPAVITSTDIKYQLFAAGWANLTAEERSWFAMRRENVCFLIHPLKRFHGLTFADLDEEVVTMWNGDKRLAATQSHYNLYMGHHKENLERPELEQRTHLLVLEEDARCVPSTLRDLSEFLQTLLRMEVKWDLIYIGGMLLDHAPLNSTGGQWLDENDDYWQPRQIYNTEALVINADVIEKVAEKLRPVNQPEPSSVDALLSLGIESGELVAVIPTQRSCVQPHLQLPSSKLFRQQDRRWGYFKHKQYQVVPMHSGE